MPTRLSVADRVLPFESRAAVGISARRVLFVADLAIVSLGLLYTVVLSRGQTYASDRSSISAYSSALRAIEVLTLLAIVGSVVGTLAIPVALAFSHRVAGAACHVVSCHNLAIAC